MSTIKAFISYSWDNEEHKNWVLKFASDLVRHGVDVILDQWDLRLGDDLAFFMEQGLTSSHLVICVCSEQYVIKANANKNGVGYEKRIISAEMINGENKQFVIPVIKNNSSRRKLPTFLSNILFEDFDGHDYFDCYRRVIARVYNEDVNAKPVIGSNPFQDNSLSGLISAKLNLEENEYYNPAMSGTVSFDYKRHNGIFTIGAGPYEFNTMWTEAGYNSIHCYRDHVFRLGYKGGESSFPKYEDILLEYDFSSRARTVAIGEVVVLENAMHRFAAIKVIDIHRAVTDIDHMVEFEYKIYDVLG